MKETSASSALGRIAQLVAARTGLVTARTLEDFERASRRAMQRLALDNLRQFAGRLEAGQGWDELLDEITIPETYFFRNPEHFELVRETILPALRSERPSGHGLRVWSAGCASGEEAYTLAIVLHELGLLDGARVHGTDISPQSLAKAKLARYRDWAFRALDPPLIERYFREDGNERELIEPIRSAVSFGRLNLASDDYPSLLGDTAEVDLIFCRNVMIYFDPPTIARVEARLFSALAPGGWLVTGPSDPMFGQHSAFEVLSSARGICYRRPSSPAIVLLPARKQVELVRSIAPPARESMRIARSLRSDRPPRLPAPDEAGLAFERADYARVVELARLHPDDQSLAALGVRAIWNQSGGTFGQRACAQALERHALSSELHYLHALALLECRRLTDALAAINKALYLDRNLIVAHFTRASILERLHDLEGARRAYRNAHDAAQARMPQEPLALGDGIVAAGMVLAAAQALAALARRHTA